MQDANRPRMLNPVLHAASFSVRMCVLHAYAPGILPYNSGARRGLRKATLTRFAVEKEGGPSGRGILRARLEFFGCQVIAKIEILIGDMHNHVRRSVVIYIAERERYREQVVLRPD